MAKRKVNAFEEEINAAPEPQPESSQGGEEEKTVRVAMYLTPRQHAWFKKRSKQLGVSISAAGQLGCTNIFGEPPSPRDFRGG